MGYYTEQNLNVYVMYVNSAVREAENMQSVCGGRTDYRAVLHSENSLRTTASPSWLAFT